MNNSKESLCNAVLVTKELLGDLNQNRGKFFHTYGEILDQVLEEIETAKRPGHMSWSLNILHDMFYDILDQYGFCERAILILDIKTRIDRESKYLF